MRPEIAVFGLTLKSYSLCAWIAAFVCAVTVWKPMRRCGYSRIGAAVTLVAMCAAFLIGARLWNVAVNPDAYGGARKWYTLRMVGLSLYGGVLGAFCALLVSVKASRVRLPSVLDAFTVPYALAFCIARIGCFLNGCCAGTRTSLPWGVVFPDKPGGIPGSIIPIKAPAVHPTQLYELLLALAGVFLCRVLVKRLRAGEGGLFFCYGAWFCALRLAILPLRSLPYSAAVKNAVYPALYGALLVLGVVLFLRSRTRVSVDR